MAWFSDFFDPRREILMRSESSAPYLLSLLLSDSRNAGLVVSRTRNYLAARAVERSRPLTVSSLPYHVVLDPSNVCNLRCPLCVQATDPEGRRRSLVHMDDFDRLLEAVEAHVIRLDLFNWGEPLLHPRFCELVARAAERSIYTRTSSHMSHENGIDAAQLVGSGLNYLVVSIDGATQPVYEKYRVNGHLSTVLRNLEKIIAERARRGSLWPVIEWQFLVLRHNEEEIDAARDLARSVGVDVFRYGGARGRMATKVLSSTPANYAESSAWLPAASSRYSEYDEQGEKCRTHEREGCRWLWGKMALHPDGGISPCWNGWFAENDFGDWRAAGIASTWTGEQYARARQAAASGGSAQGTLVCDTCAYHGSFVPTPDFDREPLPCSVGIDELARQLSAAGIVPSPDIKGAILAAVDREPAA